MKRYRLSLAAFGIALACGSAVLVEAQRGEPTPAPPSTVPPPPAFRLPGAPAPTIGASVTPAMEGWYPNPDGTFTILVGYRNRNAAQDIDVPIGPNNRIEPGGPYDQPTHFNTGRHYGVFAFVVPRDFGSRRLTYTINVNNQPQTITLGLPGGYQIQPFSRSDNGNTPPVLKLDAAGAEYVGPPRGVAKTYTGRVGIPLELTVYATDTGATIDQNAGGEPAPAPAARGARGAAVAAAVAAARGNVTLRWYKHRGPAGPTLKFSAATSPVTADETAAKMFQKPGTTVGKATVTATFAEPGEYWIRAQATDGSQLDEQCCWSSLLLRVNVTN